MNKFFDVYNNIVHLYEVENRLYFLELLDKKFPDKVSILKVLDNNYSDNRDSVKSKIVLKKLLKNDPKNAYYLCKLSLLSCEAGDYELAIAYAKKTLEIDPTFLEAYLSLWQAYNALNQFNLAIDSLTNIIKLYYNTAQEDKANKFYNNLINSKPNSKGMDMEIYLDKHVPKELKLIRIQQ